jgi:hypothetical protein
LIVPSIAIMPREGSFALLFFGRMRNIHESAFSLAAGRKSFALKRIVVLVILLDNTNRVPAKQQPDLRSAARLNRTRRGKDDIDNHIRFRKHWDLAAFDLMRGSFHPSVSNSYDDLNGPSKILSESFRRSFGLSRACNFSGSASFRPGLPTAAIAST